MSLSPIVIDDSPRPNKISRYTYDPLPAAIFVTSGKSVSMFTTPSDYQQSFEPNYDNHDGFHNIMSDNPLCSRIKRRILLQFSSWKNMQQNFRFLLFHILNQRDGLLLSWTCQNIFTVKYLIYWTPPFHIPLFIWLVCLPPFSPLLHLLNLFMRSFYFWFIDPTLFQSLFLLCLKLSYFIIVVFYFNTCDEITFIQLCCTDNIWEYLLCCSWGYHVRGGKASASLGHKS